MKAGAKKGKFNFTQFLLILLVLASLGFVAYTAVKVFEDSQNDRESLAKTAELRALFSSAVSRVRGVSAGDEEAFTSLVFLDTAIHGNLLDMQNKLLDENVGIEVNYRPLDGSWAKIRREIDQINADKDTILYLHSVADTLNETLPELQRAYGDVVDILIESRASGEQVAKAQEQLWLAERIGRNIDKILAGSDDAEAAADQFNRDARLFGRILKGMQEGDNALGIVQIRSREALALLKEISNQVEFIGGEVEAIFESTPALFETRKAVDRMLDEAPVLLNEVTGLAEQIKGLPGQREYNAQTALYGAGSAVFFIIVSVLVSLRRSRKEYRASADANTRNQDAILRLLDEIADLADGDLTSNATVTEDFTGAIADSINYTIEQLRVLVSRIVTTSSKVTSAADVTRATALELSEASEHQAQEITGAASLINEMAETIDRVSQDASKLGEEAERSVSIAKKGGEVVRGTIDGMDNIREQIQDTSKRIKRLGESSQEIGDIVSLINEIADQTNILALNAAIQASMAGEAGRGFAVVADEVQGLAERSAAATKQIASLVKAIQTDTNEAVSSMEQTTAEVVSGAELAHNAGGALEEIETVSADLAELIQGISQSAKQQAGSARDVSSAMNVIQDISSQTLIGTTSTAESIGELADMATELSESVSDFTLPEGMNSEIEESAVEVDQQSLSSLTGFDSYDEELVGSESDLEAEIDLELDSDFESKIESENEVKS
jgi:twitching motility protein PilJ